MQNMILYLNDDFSMGLIWYQTIFYVWTRENIFTAATSLANSWLYDSPIKKTKSVSDTRTRQNCTIEKRETLRKNYDNCV